MIKKQVVISFFLFRYKISRVNLIDNSLRILFLFDLLVKIIRIDSILAANTKIMSTASGNFLHHLRINIHLSMGSSHDNVIKLLCHNCMHIISHKCTWISARSSAARRATHTTNTRNVFKTFLKLCINKSSRYCC